MNNMHRFIMSKQTLLSLLILFTGISISNAQTPESLSQISATDLCGCLADTYSNIDEDVKVVIVELVRHNVENRTDELPSYGKTLSEEMRKKVESQSVDFYAHSTEANKCIKNAEGAYENLPNDNNPDNISSGQFADLIVKKMSRNKECSYAYSLYKMDLQFRRGVDTSADSQEK